MVDQGKLPPQLSFAAAQVDGQLLQPLPLLVGEHAAALGGGRQPVVAAAQNDQVPDIPPAHPVEVPGVDPVQRYRDQADIILGEHQQKESAEGLPIHFRIP